MSKQTHKEETCREWNQKANIFSSCKNKLSGNALFLVAAFFKGFFAMKIMGWHPDCQLQCPSQQAGSTSYGQAENTHHWPATVSMETTVSSPSWESVNSEWTWDDSYKLFPNLVISHFHAGMDIGLQVCWEWREDRVQKKKKKDSFYGLTFYCRAQSDAVRTVITGWFAAKWSWEPSHLVSLLHKAYNENRL